MRKSVRGTHTFADTHHPFPSPSYSLQVHISLVLWHALLAECVSLAGGAGGGPFDDLDRVAFRSRGWQLHGWQLHLPSVS